MADFNVRADSVNVEQIMEQIRGRIREKRGVDYTEQQLRELAAVKLEKFLDPRGVRSELLAEFHRAEPDQNYAFEDDTLFETHRAPIRWMRSLLRPLLKLFFNPNPLAHVLHMQSQINDRHASRDRLYYELIHNLVVETTRLGIEVKNLTMKVESLSSRVEFNERRARALESAVVYRPSPEERVAEQPPARQIAAESSPVPTASSGQSTQSSYGYGGGGGAPRAATTEGGPAGEAGSLPGVPGGAGGPGGPGQRSRRRRRRRGRRGGGGPASAIMGQPTASGGDTGAAAQEESHSTEPHPDERSDSPPEEPGNDSEQ